MNAKLMKDKHVVISLFNGMGCIWIALEKAGIQVSQRISSEVDRHAIKANNSMYPDTIQVGDVRKVEVIKNDIGKPIQLKTENGNIDLMDGEIILGGGSPCQSFSFAGKMKGMSTKDEQQVLTLDHYLKLKEQEYEFEGQSYLFWEYMRIKKDLNPRYFLLENVIMIDKWKNVLSGAIGINPIRINAGLVSAQNRDRYFWTNINSRPHGFFGDIECMIPQPKDKGILLKDILEKDVDEKYFIKRPKFGFNGMNLNRKSNTLQTGGRCTQTDKHNYDIIKIDVEGNPKKNQEKAGCLTAGGHSGGNHSDMDLLVIKDLKCSKVYNSNPDDTRNCRAVSTSELEGSIMGFGGTGGLFDREKGIRCESSIQSHAINSRIRRLTLRECGRLQTFPEEKLDILLKAGISDSQLYKQFGNGWCVDVIAHIFSYIHKK